LYTLYIIIYYYKPGVSNLMLRLAKFEIPFDIMGQTFLDSDWEDER